MEMQISLVNSMPARFFDTICCLAVEVLAEMEPYTVAAQKALSYLSSMQVSSHHPVLHFLQGDPSNSSAHEASTSLTRSLTSPYMLRTVCRGFMACLPSVIVPHNHHPEQLSLVPPDSQSWMVQLAASQLEARKVGLMVAYPSTMFGNGWPSTPNIRGWLASESISPASENNAKVVTQGHGKTERSSVLCDVLYTHSSTQTGAELVTRSRWLTRPGHGPSPKETWAGTSS